MLGDLRSATPRKSLQVIDSCSRTVGLVYYPT
jgi:hypothetical protein